MNNRLNKYKYPGAKRLMLEAQELKDNTEDYCAQPIDDNLFEWHFTVRGPPDTAFDGGYYHGRLSFPTEYPMKPPSIILLTPNGRFETNKKICLSISGYHPETWQPSWSVRTALLALIAFMPTKANRAIGSLDFSDAERRKLAAKSRTWRCECCGLIKDLLVQPESIVENRCSIIDSCEPSTSRVYEHSAELESDTQSQPSGISGSSNRVVPHADFPESEYSHEIDTETTTNIQGKLNAIQISKPEDQGAQLNQNCSHSPACSNAFSQNRENSRSLEGSEEPRRTNPQLVLKSIFILLFLLILRRVVMVIQS